MVSTPLPRDGERVGERGDSSYFECENTKKK